MSKFKKKNASQEAEISRHVPHAILCLRPFYTSAKTSTNQFSIHFFSYIGLHKCHSMCYYHFGNGVRNSIIIAPLRTPLPLNGVYKYRWALSLHFFQHWQKRGNYFGSMHSPKEVQIVYRLFLVNCDLRHVPRLPSQPASNVGG